MTMDKNKDIDRQLEFDGDQDGTSRDAYKMLFDHLETEPEIHLSPKFNEGVLQRIDSWEKRKRYNFLIMLVTGLALIFGGFVGGIVYLFGWTGLAEMQNAIYWAVTIGLTVTLFQTLDRKLIKRKVPEFS